MNTKLAQWTYQEGLDFECARELITDAMGICTANISEEMHKSSPNEQTIEANDLERTRLHHLRNSFHVNDVQVIKQVLAEYGPIVRANLEKRARELEIKPD
nr:hypothetical protein [uncultured Undibacterium sp.]